MIKTTRCLHKASRQILQLIQLPEGSLLLTTYASAAPMFLQVSSIEYQTKWYLLREELGQYEIKCQLAAGGAT